ncbi:helix-turn-helix domain-containing protein [Endozoicomonas lisbonensis]|uniref:HTH cro/C1-type domain-containing protein n=1 Tax=Endozoicomonas lisbonensis TaxID=3120522 RepID=A0ABV2SNF5_9GAMM
MCAEKVKIRAAVWIDGRQRQKVKYLPSQEAAEQWKLDTERFMQQVKVIKEMETKVGQDSPQAQALRQVLKKEGRRALSVNDCLDLLDQAENFLRVHLGPEYPSVMDASDLQAYYDKRLVENASQEELAAETLLLKLFFQWSAEEGTNSSNKVQVAFDKMIYENSDCLKVGPLPYIDVIEAEELESPINNNNQLRDEKIRQLHADDLNQKEIAAILGVNQSTVSRVLKAMKRK